MASLPARDPVGDHLLTPQNAAMVVIDYQPSQFAAVRSMDQDLLLENIVSTVKTAKAFGPHRPFDGQRCVGTPTADRAGARRAARGQPADRQDDPQRLGGGRLPRRGARHRAPQAHRLRPLDGDLHDVPRPRRPQEGLRRLPCPRRDRGTSEEAHRAGLERLIQPGGRPISWVALACELQRDRAREETVADVVEIVLTERLLKT